jgi:hypothetical protein
MEKLRHGSINSLTWVQLRGPGREFELKSGDLVFATLKWEKLFGSLATAATAEGAWTFKRVGFFKPSITIRALGSEQNVAVFSPGWTGAGTLEFANGLKLKWTNRDFWHSIWGFLDETGEDVLVFKSSPGLLKLTVQVDIKRDTPENAVLAAMGMYLLILMSDDLSATTAATMPVITSS